MGAFTGSAQQATIPFTQLEKNAQLTASVETPGNEVAISRSNGLAAASFSSSSAMTLVPSAHKPPRILDKSYFLINGSHLGLALFDVATTQHCIAAGTCREGNPLMPSSAAGQVGVAFALVGYASFISYKLKKEKSKLWWVSPAIGIGAHAAGVATGFAHF